MPEIVVDAKAVEQLAVNIQRARKQLLGRLGERGYQLLREEVPYITGNLKQGVAPPDIDYDRGEATLTVSARSAEIGSREAKVFGADGKEKKTVTLKPSPAYNYAEVVARGNKEATIKPKSAKAMLIPVATAPTDESYLIADGQIYVMRKSRKGRKANPYDERAASRLEKEATGIADAVLEKFI